MLKFIDLLEPIIWLVKVQIDNINLVIHAICVVTAYGHYELVIFAGSESYRVVLEVTLICVYLLCPSTID